MPPQIPAMRLTTDLGTPPFLDASLLIWLVLMDSSKSPMLVIMSASKEPVPVPTTVSIIPAEDSRTDVRAAPVRAPAADKANLWTMVFWRPRGTLPSLRPLANAARRLADLPLVEALFSRELSLVRRKFSSMDDMGRSVTVTDPVLVVLAPMMSMTSTFTITVLDVLEAGRNPAVLDEVDWSIGVQTSAPTVSTPLKYENMYTQSGQLAPLSEPSRSRKPGAERVNSVT
mmetsp:Transcript_2110/g.4841  ORF Transcript_2110/g.4841 Transcript_2110/m.4841 type:complete len:229 (+) Transcript_2110:1255-1941(+)